MGHSPFLCSFISCSHYWFICFLVLVVLPVLVLCFVRLLVLVLLVVLVLLLLSHLVLLLLFWS